MSTASTAPGRSKSSAGSSGSSWHRSCISVRSRRGETRGRDDASAPRLVGSLLGRRARLRGAALAAALRHPLRRRTRARRGLGSSGMGRPPSQRHPRPAAGASRSLPWVHGARGASRPPSHRAVAGATRAPRCLPGGGVRKPSGGPRGREARLSRGGLLPWPPDAAPLVVDDRRWQRRVCHAALRDRRAGRSLLPGAAATRRLDSDGGALRYRPASDRPRAPARGAAARPAGGPSERSRRDLDRGGRLALA